MNSKKYMIIIDGRIQTSNVRFCKYNATTKKWDVTFANGSIDSIEYRRVKWLKNPTELNPNKYRISRAGHTFSDIKEIYVFESKENSYWHICFQNGSERDYLGKDLDIIETCLSEKQASNVFEYIKQIASLSELKNEETGEKILLKRFEKIEFVGRDVALAKYLTPDKYKEKPSQQEYIPIFPFGCNNSQYKAVKNAMENQISVIQGPPGTGKTQTILNIIANILIQNKTVQVVSNNNSATGNVYEKLASSKYDLGFVAATLGKDESKKSFIAEQSATYPDFSTWKLPEQQDISLNSIKEKSAKLKSLFDGQEKLAALRQEYAQLETELEYFNQYINETNVNMNSVKARKNLASKSWMELWQECQFLSEEKQKISFLFKIKGFLQYGIFDFEFYRQDMSKIITTFQAKYYKRKAAELTKEITEVETHIKSVNAGLLDEMCKESMQVLKDILASKYNGKTKRVRFNEDDLWKNAQEVLKEYPVILSTTFSSTNSLNGKVIYDYLIIDEASQVDIATGALALSCAKNVVIVGDTKQLPNVVTEENKKQAQMIFEMFKINEGYQFTKSFLQSTLEVMPNVTQTLLREHYRCHPKIINFCNQKFYRNELIIMTEDKGEQDVLAAVKTAPGNHVRNHYSQRQIDVIKKEIIPNYVKDKNETGIIAPYKNQVEALEKEFKDIDVATVHKFQGKEKDTIIISTVDDEITDFADDPYLINVAVSRAKKKLLLVVTGNEQVKERNITDLISYIQYNNFEVTESKIYSIFDYLYKQYTAERKKYLASHKKVSEYDSENLMQALLEEILMLDKFACLDVVCHFPMNMLIKDPKLLNEEECRYAMNPATHMDFLVYNRISKKPVLVVEVDGYDYHKQGTKQSGRDLLKDHILELYGIPALRFKTNGSEEKAQIIEKLEEIIG